MYKILISTFVTLFFTLLTIASCHRDLIKMINEDVAKQHEMGK